jgi:hypothetical protein
MKFKKKKKGALKSWDIRVILPHRLEKSDEDLVRERVVGVRAHVRVQRCRNNPSYERVVNEGRVAQRGYWLTYDKRTGRGAHARAVLDALLSLVNDVKQNSKKKKKKKKGA